jgi:RHS repeat-associated protein
LFTGLYLDQATGIVFADQRTLLVTTGQWMQEDPIWFQAGDANLRRYVGNNATNLIDPSGLDATSASGFVGGGIIGAVAALRPPRIGLDQDFRRSGGPVYGDRGAFAWCTNWMINVHGNPGRTSGTKGGYAFQHVVIGYDIKAYGADNKIRDRAFDALLVGEGGKARPISDNFAEQWRLKKDDPFVIDYWEIWRFDPDTREPIKKHGGEIPDWFVTMWARTQKSFIPKQPYSDLYLQGSFASPHKLKGRITWTGELYYVDGMDEKDLPKEFQKYELGDKAPVGAGTGMPTRGNEKIMDFLENPKPGFRVSEKVMHSIEVTFDDNDKSTMGRTQRVSHTLDKIPSIDRPMR